MLQHKEANVIFIDFASYDSGKAKGPAKAAVIQECPSLHLRPGTISDEGSSKNDEGRGIKDEESPKLMSDLYTRAEVAKLFSINPSRLRSWDEGGLLRPTGVQGSRRYYTFQDLIGLRTLKSLLDAGVSIQRARKMMESLGKALPRVSRPLNELRIRADGKTIIVTGPEGTFEPESGQILIDFEVRALKDRIVKMRGEKETSRKPKNAYEWYLMGCKLDESQGTSEQAEAAYRKAIEVDPTLSNAYTNLGNIYYRRNAIAEARELYLKALEVDPQQPEAHYNLGFLYFDMNQPDKAIPLFEEAVALDPEFADAYFNLAMSLFESGRSKESRPYWEHYLSLEPNGPWADVARHHLKKIK